LKNKTILLVLILIFVIIIYGCSGDKEKNETPDTIKIGATGPLSGPSANSGIALKNGMEMAIEEWNDEGGIEINESEVPIELIHEDNQAEPSEAVSTAEKLIDQDDVDFLIGDTFGSSQTMAVMDLAEQYEIPIMSGEPVSSAISEKIEEDIDQYKYFWKGNFSSEGYGESAYETINTIIDDGDFEPKDKKIAYIVEDTDYGHSNVAEAQKLFEEDDWEEIAFETVDLDYTDFYSQLTKLKDLDPDVLITVFTSVSSGVSLVKQFDEIDLDAMHYAIYYPLRPEFYEQAKENSEGLIWEPLSYDPELIEEQQEFDNDYEELFDEKGDSDAAQGYDYMNNVLTAISEAGSTDADEIVEQMESLSNDGVIGHYEFDENNHTIKYGPDYVPVPSAQVQEDETNEIIWPENTSTEKYKTQPWLK